jgi:hypothetical protein
MMPIRAGKRSPRFRAMESDQTVHAERMANFLPRSLQPLSAEPVRSMAYPRQATYEPRSFQSSTHH